MKDYIDYHMEIMNAMVKINKSGVNHLTVESYIKSLNRNMLTLKFRKEKENMMLTWELFHFDRFVGSARLKFRMTDKGLKAVRVRINGDCKEVLRSEMPYIAQYKEYVRWLI